MKRKSKNLGMGIILGLLIIATGITIYFANKSISTSNNEPDMG